MHLDFGWLFRSYALGLWVVDPKLCTWTLGAWSEVMHLDFGCLVRGYAGVRWLIRGYVLGVRVVGQRLCLSGWSDVMH